MLKDQGRTAHTFIQGGTETRQFEDRQTPESVLVGLGLGTVVRTTAKGRIHTAVALQLSVEAKWLY